MSAAQGGVSRRPNQFLSRRSANRRLPFVNVVALMAPAWMGMACAGGESGPTSFGEGGSPGTGGDSTTLTGGSHAASGGSQASGGTTTSAGGAANGGSPMSSGGKAATGGTAPTSAGAATTGGSATTSGGGPSATGGALTSSGGSGAGSQSTGGSAGKASSGGAASTGGSGGAIGTGGAATGDRATTEGVCARWKADRANLSEGTWSGSTASCDKGDISADGRANALRLYNLYRWLGNMPAVVTEPTRDSMAQACALMQYANGSLSHEPPTSWKCYTQEGADGSKSSNISGGPGVSSVDAYMIDNGNATTLGHRRWILSNSLGPIGLGSTGKGSSCMQNLNGTGKAGKAFVVWPPQGIVPIQAFGSGKGATLDSTGWMVQSDSINLAGATVKVSANGADAPVTVTALGSGYGSRYALRFNPSGWTSKAGTTYAVAVTGIPTAINYDVQVVDCP